MASDAGSRRPPPAQRRADPCGTGPHRTHAAPDRTDYKGRELDNAMERTAILSRQPIALSDSMSYRIPRNISTIV